MGFWSEDEKPKAGGIITIIILLLVAIAFGMAGCPAYNVWTSGMSGRAALNEARILEGE